MRSLLLSEFGQDEFLQRLKVCFPEFCSEGILDTASLYAALGISPMTPFLSTKPLRWEEAWNISRGHHLIQGENLQVLRHLSSLQEKIKMVVIDPPYNTGKTFAYSDRWAKRHHEPFFRQHGDWLTMMGVRMQYARALLAKDGAIFICIDDHELAQLRMLCDAVFGATNFVQTFIWLHGKGKKDSHSRTMQQYILCYAKDKSMLSPWNVRVLKSYQPTSNPDKDVRGAWFSGSISFSEKRSNPKHPQYFTISSPSGVQWTRQWLCTKKMMQEYLSKNDIYFGPKPEQNRVPRRKMFSFEDNIIPPSILEGVGTTRSAQRRMDEILGEKGAFLYPKPVPLFKRLLEMATEPGDWVLDFFAGTATTMQAALELDRYSICIQKKEPKPSKKENTIWKDVFSMAEHRVRRGLEQEIGAKKIELLRTCEESGALISKRTISKEKS